MNYLSAIDVSAWGMAVERLKVDVSSLNVANANTATRPGVAGFQPLRVAVKPTVDFSDWLSHSAEQMPNLGAVSLEKIETSPRLVQDPTHPYANDQGFVEYPAVNPVDEMTNVMVSSRAYEANIRVINVARQMAQRALEIGS